MVPVTRAPVVRNLRMPDEETTEPRAPRRLGDIELLQEEAGSESRPRIEIAGRGEADDRPTPCGDEDVDARRKSGETGQDLRSFLRAAQFEVQQALPQRVDFGIPVGNGRLESFHPLRLIRRRDRREGHRVLKLGTP